MSTAGQPPRTPGAMRRFKIWFGAIFLTLGIVALLIGSVGFVTLRPLLGIGEQIWAYVGAPFALGIAFSILGGTFVWLGVQQLRKEQRLLRFGTTTEATIVEIEMTGTRVNRRRLWHIRYTYDDMYGVAHAGESGYLTAEDAQSYRVGGTAFVRYDPSSPSTSIWLGREELPGRA
jgi:hypothetical protein